MRSTSDNDPVKLWYVQCGAAYYGLFLRISGSVALSEQMLEQLFCVRNTISADLDIPAENSFKHLLPEAVNIVMGHVGREKVLQWLSTI